MEKYAREKKLYFDKYQGEDENESEEGVAVKKYPKVVLCYTLAKSHPRVVDEDGLYCNGERAGKGGRNDRFRWG